MGYIPTHEQEVGDRRWTNVVAGCLLGCFGLVCIYPLPQQFLVGSSGGESAASFADGRVLGESRILCITGDGGVFIANGRIAGGGTAEI